MRWECYLDKDKCVGYAIGRKLHEMKIDPKINIRPTLVSDHILGG